MLNFSFNSKSRSDLTPGERISVPKNMNISGKGGFARREEILPCRDSNIRPFVPKDRCPGRKKYLANKCNEKSEFISESSKLTIHKKKRRPQMQYTSKLTFWPRNLMTFL